MVRVYHEMNMGMNTGSEDNGMQMNMDMKDDMVMK
jgi:hypothetical protein